MEALRRQKVGIEGQGAGWVTAEKAATMGPRQTSAQESMSLHSSGTLRVPPSQGGDGRVHEGIDGWWSVEPAGAISLKLDFGTSLCSKLLLLVRADTLLSQGHRWWWAKAIRSSRSTRCCPKAKGRCLRNERPQIRSTTVLPAHHVCFVSRVPPHWRRIPVRGLSIRLSQEVLPKGRHQVYLKVECRWRESHRSTFVNLTECTVLIGCRRATRKRSITVFLIDSALTPTCRPTGVATVATCYPSDVKTRSSARNAQSRVIRRARI